MVVLNQSPSYYRTLARKLHWAGSLTDSSPRRTEHTAMPLEIERRFLVSGSDWREHAGEPQPLRQGYLASSEQGITVRMRLRADGRAWLTLKAPMPMGSPARVRI